MFYIRAGPKIQKSVIQSQKSKSQSYHVYIRTDLSGNCTTQTIVPVLDSRTKLDLTVCPLNKEFTIFLHNFHFPNAFPLKNPDIVKELESSLKEKRSWAENQAQACITMILIESDSSGDTMNQVGSTHNMLKALPGWNNGINHVVVDISNPLEASALLGNIDTGRAVLSSGYLLPHNQYHIYTPPIYSFPNDFSSMPTLFSTPEKSHLLYFAGRYSSMTTDQWTSKKNDERLNIVTKCQDDYSMCGSLQERLTSGSKSKFSLIYGSSTASYYTSARLIEALRCGSVPVIIGTNRLPFDTIINWNRAAVILPSTAISPSDIISLLLSIPIETYMEYRRQGRFLVDMYFKNQLAVLNTIVAIVRYKFLHPPPPFSDFEAKVLYKNNIQSKLPPSPKFLNNFSIYTEDFWNSPPGPFYMYSVTPYTPSYVPPMYYRPADNDKWGPARPMLKEGFRSSLHGNSREEGFTVVSMTYRRTQHLPDFIKNFKDCQFLAKIVIVWNNAEDIPDKFSLPDIGVPIEVGSCVIHMCFV